MKPVEEVTACVVDFGTFISVGEKLAETMRTVYYHSPMETEYRDIRNCVNGDGLDRLKRLSDIFDPEIFETIDLFVFTDIGFSGLQKYLRSIGKAVWGQMGATDLELNRDFFLDVLKGVGLPIVHSEVIVGISALAEYLKENDNKWVKVNQYRANMETWHHENYEHSQSTLANLAVIFGGLKEYITFVVQDDIESDMEVGYDGWCIDGNYPAYSFQGYEKKNELYLGSVMADEDLPDEIKTVNEAMSPVLAHYGYRDWWATEVRVADGVPYFIDPTPRMPGQTGEHQLESIVNFADLIWRGANGIIVKPEFAWQFAAEATLHYDKNTKDSMIDDEWKTLDIPEEALRWTKLYHYCKINGLYQFRPHHCDEIGVVVGGGDSVESAIENLTDNLALLKGLPIHANVGGFASLIECIKEAEKEGIKFGGRIPKPEAIYKAVQKAA